VLDGGQKKLGTDGYAQLVDSASKYLPTFEISTKTDDAAYLQSSLAERDPQKRDGQLRLIYRTLNSEQIEKAESDFAKKSGASSVEEAFRKAGVSENTLKAIDTYKTAAKENRPVSAEERANLARLGASSGNRDLLIESVAGNSAEATVARTSLKGDRAFNAGLSRNFQERVPSSTLTAEQLADPVNRVDRVLRDYLKEGQVQLSSVAEANTGYFFGNKENIDLAVRNARPEEVKEFRQGYELAQKRGVNSGTSEPLSADQERSLRFYEQLQNKFDRAGNHGDALRWQDTLLNGRETIVSQLSKTEKDGLFWGSSHTTSDALSAAGKLSERDWRTLRNADHGATEAERNEGQTLRKQFDQAVDKFAQSPAESQRIKSLITEKTAKETFSEAQKVGRPLDVSLSDAQVGNHRQQLQESLKVITAITPDQARQYRDDPEFRKQVKAQLALGPIEALPLSERLLKQVEATGQPPKLDGLDKIEHSSLTGNHLTVSDVQDLLRNPDLAKRFSRPDSQLTSDEKRVNRSLDTAIFDGLSSRRLNEKPLLLNEHQQGNAESQLREAAAIRREMAGNGGKLSLEQQYRLNLPIKDIYANLASAPEREQKQFVSKLVTSTPRQEIASAVVKQGEVRLEDLARSYSIEGKDAKGFSKALDIATPDEVTKAKSDWSQKYPGDLTTKVLEKANDAESPALRAVLKPSGDGREMLYDNYQKYLKGRGGLSLDGTGLTLERASQLHQDAQKAYAHSRQGLPADQQRQLDEFFGKSLQENRDSKEKQTQILLDAAITATTLGSGAATTVARVATRIAAGGVTEAAGTALARGEFKAESFVADFVQGGSSAYAGRAARQAGENIAAKLERNTAYSATVKQAELEVVASSPVKKTAAEAPAHTARIEKPVEAKAGQELAKVADGLAEATALKPGLEIKSEGASKAFTDKIASAAGALPPELTQKLKDQGISIEVVSDIHGYSKDKAFLDIPIRGQQGKTQRDSVAFFDGEQKKIVIVEKSLAGVENWPGDTVRRATAHELGHPIDANLISDVLKHPEFARSAQAGRPLLSSRISDLPEFQKAAFADMQHFSRTLPTLGLEERSAATKLVGYDLAKNGYHQKQLGLDGIGTHTDNKAYHDANGIRHNGGRHSNGRSEAFADIHSDLLTGEDLFTKHLPNTTRLIRDQVLNLPTVPLQEVTAERLKSFGFREVGQAGGRTWLEAADKSSAVIHNGRLSGLNVRGVDYEFGYAADGALSKIESPGKKFELIDGAWQKFHPGGVEKLPHRPVISKLGDGRMQFFEQ
jgi:hypothetical protein